MPERISISTKTRYRILERDGHTCQYCGRKAPDVILEVDHIISVDNGGSNDESNLITACFDCNRGKRENSNNNKAKEIAILYARSNISGVFNNPLLSIKDKIDVVFDFISNDALVWFSNMDETKWTPINDMAMMCKQNLLDVVFRVINNVQDGQATRSSQIFTYIRDGKELEVISSVKQKDNKIYVKLADNSVVKASDIEEAFGKLATMKVNASSYIYKTTKLLKEKESELLSANREIEELKEIISKNLSPDQESS